MALPPYPLRIWDVMIDYDFDIQHFQGDGNGLMELYEIVMEYQHGIAYPVLEITNLLLIILLQKFEITVDVGGITNLNGAPMTLEDRMNAIITLVCYEGAPRLAELEGERDATYGNGYDTDATQNGNDTDHFGESDDEYN